ncbi:MAG: hypothetical protein LBV67_01970, partial [Streptococcaceae bacterium]|nr:hypothetical protein [Streptococcaceae bacterium]
SKNVFDGGGNSGDVLLATMEGYNVNSTQDDHGAVVTSKGAVDGFVLEADGYFRYGMNFLAIIMGQFSSLYMNVVLLSILVSVGLMFLTDVFAFYGTALSSFENPSKLNSILSSMAHSMVTIIFAGLSFKIFQALNATAQQAKIIETGIPFVNTIGKAFLSVILAMGVVKMQSWFAEKLVGQGATDHHANGKDMKSAGGVLAKATGLSAVGAIGKQAGIAMSRRATNAGLDKLTGKSAKEKANKHQQDTQNMSRSNSGTRFGRTDLDNNVPTQMPINTVKEARQYNKGVAKEAKMEKKAQLQGKQQEIRQERGTTPEQLSERVTNANAELVKAQQEDKQRGNTGFANNKLNDAKSELRKAKASQARNNLRPSNIKENVKNHEVTKSVVGGAKRAGSVVKNDLKEIGGVVQDKVVPSKVVAKNEIKRERSQSIQDTGQQAQKAQSNVRKASQIGSNKGNSQNNSFTIEQKKK